MDDNQDTRIPVVLVDVSDGQAAVPIDPNQIRIQLAKAEITGDDVAAALVWAHQLIQQNGETDA